MKKVYELNFKVNNEWRNLLYSSRKRAQKDLETNYKEGAMHIDEIIENSYIIQRTLF